MERAPLAPRPEYLPRPEPMPWPTRFFECFCPAGGFRLLRFIELVHQCKQMRDLFPHAAKTYRIRPLPHVIELLQAQRPDDNLVLLRRADGAAHQFDLDL